MRGGLPFLGLAVLTAGWGCSGEQALAPIVLDPVILLASADRTQATTGDLIHFEVRSSWDPTFDVQVELPELPDGLPLVDAVHGEPVLEDGRYEQVWSYRLRADRVGVYSLPAARSRYSLSAPSPQQERFVESATVRVEVESVLMLDAEATDIRDIKPLRVVRENSRWPLWVGLAGLAIALLFGFWLWRRKSSVETAPALPAHVVALAALRELEDAEVGNLEALRNYYFEISVVLRTYVEGRFFLNATDLTTEEILENLGCLDLRHEDGGVLQRFLVDSDLVKFAAHVPSRDEIRQTWDRALRFVEGTKPQEAEAVGTG